MQSLSLPVPVAVFIRRLFNVFSSITVSSQYYLLQKAESESGKDGRINGKALRRSEGSPVRSETLLARSVKGQGERDTANLFLHSHWGRLKPWPWNTASAHPTRRAHSVSVDEANSQGSVEENQPTEKPTPPSTPSPERRTPPTSHTTPNEPLTPIYSLMLNPTLFDPIRAPRNPIVLCHGLYGYDVRGPSNFPMLQLHYWAHILKILKKKIGAEVIVTGVPGTGSVESRAERLDQYLRKAAPGRDINFVAHSMGGLDCRHLITHVKPKEYNPASLTTVCTPHRGSPFMDWCSENIGIGKLQRQAEKVSQKASESTDTPTVFSLTNLPSSLTTLLLSVLDSPAYANLSTQYLQNIFNPATPDDPRVRYYSVAARTKSMNVWHPLFLPKTVLDGVEAREREEHSHPEEEQWGNDGLVTVRSARWGEFLGILEGADHWDVRGGGGLGPDNEWNIDLALPNSLKNSLSDPFSHVNVNFNWKDWSRLVGAWRKEVEDREDRERKSPSEKKSSADESQKSKDREAEDAALKSSTDKLSAVFDWIVEQVPYSPRNSSTTTTPSSADIQSSPPRPSAFVSPAVRKAEDKRIKAKKESEAGDPRLKFDLERFYVALSRKLYDDGL
ncbi:alpha/beta-hydrolase [Fomitiporia mediterranea MF3/22]|uniref:alpha/beta-hydrolase n=1 Tax=Fomitiporia mediterranea (strain MF3/22) TaxID=694068 RepID=UPI0004407964|nr:alpha/beta-hydrolase [Fomitiporia mediterranea MF3/22]EJC98498.1 alpha/beta-hydrolase [Fomitiporia mediterranea MF3/22]